MGAINEKVESFYDVCMAQGFTGNQGVLIPSRNVEGLMLRPDVVKAIEKGEFEIYAIETVEEGIEVLTGVEAGKADESGNYPVSTVFGAIQARLERFGRVLAHHR